MVLLLTNSSLNRPSDRSPRFCIVLYNLVRVSITLYEYEYKYEYEHEFEYEHEYEYEYVCTLKIVKEIWLVFMKCKKSMYLKLGIVEGGLFTS